jgi:outer membrane receptor protein involved in Fe transport
MNNKQSYSPNTVVLRRVFSVGVSLLMVLPAAWAQTGSEPTELEKVVVTGSLIPTAETVTATPVAVVSAVELERRDVRAVEQLAKILPSAVGAGNFGSSRGNGGDGSSSIALRGIPGGTLVLINGRRLAPNSFFDGSTVDLNTIPLAAVERIEILKDGGSAIYGADAVAGVVNFILKKNYNGTELNAYYGNTTDTDVSTQTYSFITGASDEQTSFLIGGSYFKKNSLFSKDRSRSAPDITQTSNTSGTSNPGGFNVPNNLRGDNKLYNPNASPTANVRVRVKDDAVPDAQGRYSKDDYRPFTNADRFPFPLYTPAIRPAEMYHFFGNGERQLIGDALKFFTEGSYSHTWTFNQLAPTPFNSAFSPATIPASNFYNPFGIDLTSWAYRLVELGPRTEEIRADTFRIITGLRGEIPDTTIKWETAFLYARDRRAQRLGGDFSFNKVKETIGRTTPDAFNPFGRQSNSQALLDEIGEPLFTLADQELWSVDLTVNGELFDLPAGPVGFAVGGVYHEESLAFEPDYPQRSGDLVGFNQAAPLHGARDVYSAFAEISIPITSPEKEIPGFYSLEITGAGRLDKYSDFGTTWNPKVSVRWQPIDKSLTLRGSYSTSFRAPTFSDLYTLPSEDFPELRNPVVFADPNRGPNDPFAFTQIRTLRSGNPSLKPEEAENFTAGLVYTPSFVKNLTLSWDWFHINQENVPASVDQLILDDNFADGGPFDPNAIYANLIVADPNSPEIYQLLRSPTLNLSQRILEGFDVGVRYDIPTENVGTFTLAVDFTYFYRFDQENVPGEGLKDRLGDFVDPTQGFGLGTLPRLKGNVSALWAIRGFEFGATAYYIDGFKDDTAAIGYSRDVDSIITLDLQASYTIQNSGHDWLDNTKFTAGCINVMDEEPPRTVAAFADNYDRDTHDLRGRFWYVALNKKF